MIGTLVIHREDVKAEIRKRHGSILAFEERAGLKSGTVVDFLRGRSSKPTAMRVAAELGMTVEHLVNGLRESDKRDTGSRFSNRTHRQKAVAA